MYTCLYVHMCICICVCMYVYIYIYVHMIVYISLSLYICICVRIHIYRASINSIDIMIVRFVTLVQKAGFSKGGLAIYVLPVCDCSIRRLRV